jgi:hypothetical protein
MLYTMRRYLPIVRHQTGVFSGGNGSKLTYYTIRLGLVNVPLATDLRLIHTSIADTSRSTTFNFCVWPQVLPPPAYDLAVVCIVDANE